MYKRQILNFIQENQGVARDEMHVFYIPVSYTHLDVYKRQIEYTLDFSGVYTLLILGHFQKWLTVKIFEAE